MSGDWRSAETLYPGLSSKKLAVLSARARTIVEPPQTRETAEAPASAPRRPSRRSRASDPGPATLVALGMPDLDLDPGLRAPPPPPPPGPLPVPSAPEPGDLRDQALAYNVRPDPIDFRDRFYEPRIGIVPDAVSPPKGYDAVVRNQGGDSSCTGQALAAAIDLINLRRGVGASRVSARMLYEMARAYDEHTADGLDGSSLRGAMKGFFHNGVCSEDLAPFEAFQPGWVLTLPMAKDARRTGLGGYFRVRHIAHDYHAALAECGHVVASAFVHDGWTRTATLRAQGRIVQQPNPIGAHAFVIVGYDADGFLVLNSDGRRWGGFLPNGSRPGGELPGVGHWSYEDWAENALDAWVVQLTSGSSKTFHLVGGHRAAGTRPEPPTTPRIEINGHYLRFDATGLLFRGSYASDPAGVGVTADFLRSDAEKPEGERSYERVLFLVETGLDDLRTMARRTAAMIPVFKRNKIYPIVLFWRQGILARFREIVAAQGERIARQVGGREELQARAVEEFVGEFLTPLWSKLCADADANLGAPSGEVLVALERLLTAALHGGERKVHIAAAGPGVHLVSPLLRALANADAYRPSRISGVTLLAPACRREVLDEIGDRAGRRAGRARGTLHALAELDVQADRLQGYGRSLALLVGRAFCGGYAPSHGEDAADAAKRIGFAGDVFARDRVGHAPIAPAALLDHPIVLDALLEDVMRDMDGPRITFAETW